MSNCKPKKAYLLNYNPPTDTTNIIYYCNIEWECMVYWIQEPCDEMVSQYLPSSNPWSSSRHVFTNISNTNLRFFCTNIMYYLYSFSPMAMLKTEKIAFFDLCKLQLRNSGEKKSYIRNWKIRENML